MRHNSMRSTRARRAVFAVAFAVVAIAWSADRVVVEDWRSYPTGTRGIPGGDWKEQSWGKAVYDLEIVSDNGQPVLHLRSKGETSTINRDLKASVDPKETPILEWRWKVMKLPTGAHAGGGALAHHRLRLGFDGAGRHDLQEREDFHGDLYRPALGLRRTRQMDHRAPQCRRRLSQDLWRSAGQA